MIRLAVEYHLDSCPKIVLDCAGRTVSIDGFETVEFLHGFEFFLDQPLIFDEAGIHVRGPVHIHAGFPIVEHGVLSEISFHENFGAHREIEDCVGHQGDAVDVAYPCRFDAAYDRARHQGVDVAVGEDDEAGAQSRDDAVFQLIGEVGGIEQAEGSGAEDVALHRLFEFAADEHRALQSDIGCRIAAAFEPVAQEIDLCRASGAVGALDNDELSLEFVQVSARQSLTVKLFWAPHVN
jgi:hypothetical protein